MRVPRKKVTSALFELLAGCYPWVTADPRLQLPEELPGGQQPALFLVKPQEHIEQEPASNFTMRKYTLTYFALVLVYSASIGGNGNGDFSAEEQMADIMDAMDNALAPNPGEPQTLGGLVTNCWMDGEVFIDTPVFFQHCAIWIPIKCVVGM
jgi:hypothetical protein